jgi:FkbM family methyltransferase
MFITPIIKFLVDVFASIIKKNKDVLKYLFTISLKDEVCYFYENEYLINYEHIHKSIRLVKQFLKNNFSIIDVGGADGITPIIFSKSFPSNKIWIFEPIKENCLKIDNLKKQFPNFSLIPKAAGNYVGKSVINIAESLASSSIFELNIDNSSKVFSNALNKKSTEEIEITKLDISIPENEIIGILKIDVQGYELEVLKGAVNTLIRTSVIVLEMNNHDGYKDSPKYFELDKFLRDQNFTLYDIFPSLKDDGRLKEWDSLYVNNMHL